MLLDMTGLNVAALDAVLASVLGAEQGQAGHKVVAEAVEASRSRVALQDWLFCLIRAPGTLLRKYLIDGPGQKVERFVELAGDHFPPGTPGAILTRLAPDTIEPNVGEMLDAAERLARTYSRSRVEDAALTLALVDAVEAATEGLLTLFLKEEGLKRLREEAKRRLGGGIVPPLFDEKGKLKANLFSPGGRRFCRRMQEDGASMGAQKLTSRHLLYSLLSSESNVLVRSLGFLGVKVKTELHAVLTRELVRPGRPRNSEFELTEKTLFAAVVQVFQEAQKVARDRGSVGVGEDDLCRAFVARQASELSRLFTESHPLDVAALREYLQSDQPEEETEEKPIERFTTQQIADKINQTIFGQPMAVARVIPWVKRLRFGIPRDSRPAGVFLFMGPTGCGKTQLAKELARYVYGSDQQLLFFEMGQYKTKESMSQFIGAPPGYVGYGDGKLTNGLRDKPESVVLFDEIEKADTQVFDTLLRFADEGVISDPAGPMRDGRKCLIVMTTNAGQNWLRGHLRTHGAAARADSKSLTAQLFEEAMKELRQGGFRPEFLGRVDERIVFLPLSEETCREIIDSNLAKEVEKFRALKEVVVDVEDEVRAVLAAIAYERTMDEGARGAPRAINDHIVSPLIDLLATLDDEGKPLPKRVKAVRQGMTEIVLEVAE